MRRKVQLYLVRVRLLLILYPGKVTDSGRLSHATRGLLLCRLNVLEFPAKSRMEGVSTCIKHFNEPYFSYWLLSGLKRELHQVMTLHLSRCTKYTRACLKVRGDTFLRTAYGLSSFWKAFTAT